MGSRTGAVMGALQRLDAGLCSLEWECVRYAQRLGVKRLREEDLVDLWEFLDVKASENSLPFNVEEIKHFESLFETPRDAIMIFPLNLDAENGREVFIAFVDSVFRMYTKYHIKDRHKKDKSEKRLSNSTVEYFESISNYDSIDSVWTELKRLFKLSSEL